MNVEFIVWQGGKKSFIFVLVMPDYATSLYHHLELAYISGSGVHQQRTIGTRLSHI